MLGNQVIHSIHIFQHIHSFHKYLLIQSHMTGSVLTVRQSVKQSGFKSKSPNHSFTPLCSEKVELFLKPNLLPPETGDLVPGQNL